MSQIDVLRPPERRVLYSLVIVKGSLSSNSIHRSQKNKMGDKTSCSVDEKKRKLRSQGFSKKKQEASLQSFIEGTIKHQHSGQGQRWLCVNGRAKLMYGAIASRPNSKHHHCLLTNETTNNINNRPGHQAFKRRVITMEPRPKKLRHEYKLNLFHKELKN